MCILGAVREQEESWQEPYKSRGFRAESVRDWRWNSSGLLGHPAAITTDGGFASKDNYDYAVGKGIKKVLFTKKCSSKIAELVKANRAYKKLKKFRAGIEGCISAAKRSYGLSRCTWKGWRSFQSYVWVGVIAFNLSIMANALLK